MTITCTMEEAVILRDLIEAEARNAKEMSEVPNQKYARWWREDYVKYSRLMNKIELDINKAEAEEI